MNFNKNIVYFLIILFSYLFLKNKLKESYGTSSGSSYSSIDSPMLNIYDQPLQSCGSSNMKNGSWDNEFKCSETTGGVHQICIKDISNNTTNFSKKTGQSNWSEKRGNDNHCVCLGAWSLYNTKNDVKNNILKCDAIPKIALSNKYVSKFSEGWNKWNGLELNDQIKNGVESLVKNCYKPNDNKSINLKNNYCNFARNVDVLKKSNLYKNLCL